MIGKLQGTSTMLPSGVAGAGGISTQTVRVDSLSLITSTAPPKKESGGPDGCRIPEAGICNSNSNSNSKSNSNSNSKALQGYIRPEKVISLWEPLGASGSLWEPGCLGPYKAL